MKITISLLIISSVLSSIVDVGAEVHDSVWKCINNNPQTKELARILNKPEFQDLAALLASHDETRMYTIMAPSNEAMSQFSSLSNNTEVDVKDVLRYHILPGLVTGTMINSLHFAPSSLILKGHAQGMKLARLLDGGIQLSAGPLPPANIINPDIPSSNGIVHVIDKIVLPPFTVQETLKRANLTRFLSLVSHNDAIELMDKPSGGSVFAPTNEALEAYAAKNPGFLKSDNAIFRFVKGHFAPNQVRFSTRISSATTTTLTTLTGPIQINRSGQGLFIDSIPIRQADLITRFGVLHILGGVLPSATNSTA